MRALKLDDRDVHVVDAPLPHVEDETALVRVNIAGICNTDLELVKGYMGFRGILGHEFVGVVEEGPAEWKGRRVVGEINFACRECPVCYRGMQRHCPSRRVMGILEADGTFAEYVAVPVANLHAVPEGVSDDAAVFAEPLAAAYEIAQQVSVEPGIDCVVLGDGKLGLLAAQVLERIGARVLAVGKHPEKLRLLDKRGIETRLLSEWVPEPTSLVIEATGSAQGFELAVAATRPRGTLVLKSTVTERPDVDLSAVVVNEIQVVGSRCGPFPPALRALETGAVDVRSLICDRVSLENAVKGLERANAPGALKVLIEVG